MALLFILKREDGNESREWEKENKRRTDKYSLLTCSYPLLHIVYVTY